MNRRIIVLALIPVLLWATTADVSAHEDVTAVSEGWFLRWMPANSTLLFEISPRIPMNSDQFDNATIRDLRIGFAPVENYSLSARIELYNLTIVWTTYPEGYGTGDVALWFLQEFNTTGPIIFELEEWENYVSLGRGWLTIWWPEAVLLMHNTGADTMLNVSVHRSWDVYGYEESESSTTLPMPPSSTTTTTTALRRSDYFILSLEISGIVVLLLAVGCILSGRSKKE